MLISVNWRHLTLFFLSLIIYLFLWNRDPHCWLFPKHTSPLMMLKFASQTARWSLQFHRPSSILKDGQMQPTQSDHLPSIIKMKRQLIRTRRIKIYRVYLPRCKIRLCLNRKKKLQGIFNWFKIDKYCFMLEKYKMRQEQTA